MVTYVVWTLFRVNQHAGGLQLEGKLAGFRWLHAPCSCNSLHTCRKLKGPQSNFFNQRRNRYVQDACTISSDTPKLMKVNNTPLIVKLASTEGWVSVRNCGFTTCLCFHVSWTSQQGTLRRMTTSGETETREGILLVNTDRVTPYSMRPKKGNTNFVRFATHFAKPTN